MVNSHLDFKRQYFDTQLLNEESSEYINPGLNIKFKLYAFIYIIPYTGPAHIMPPLITKICYYKTISM